MLWLVHIGYLLFAFLCLGLFVSDLIRCLRLVCCDWICRALCLIVWFADIVVWLCWVCISGEFWLLFGLCWRLW